MSLFSGTIWRLYLSALVILTGLSIYFATIAISDWRTRDANRKSLMQFIVKNQRPEQGLNLGIHFFGLIGTDYECLDKLVQNSGGLSSCVQLGSYDDFKPFGLDKDSFIGGEPHLFSTKICLITLAILLALRYWITWVRSGKFPRRFP